MNVDDIVYILDLFPDAEVIVEKDGTLKIRRLGELVGHVNSDGSIQMKARIASWPLKRTVFTATC